MPQAVGQFAKTKVKYYPSVDLSPVTSITGVLKNCELICNVINFNYLFYCSSRHVDITGIGPSQMSQLLYRLP